MYHTIDDMVLKDIWSLLFSHESFKGIIQCIHKRWMMNWWLGSCKFAGKALVSVSQNVFVLICLPAMKNVIHIEVVSVVRLRSQILYKITLIRNCLSLVFQSIEPETEPIFSFRGVKQNVLECFWLIESSLISIYPLPGKPSLPICFHLGLVGKLKLTHEVFNSPMCLHIKHRIRVVLILAP